MRLPRDKATSSKGADGLDNTDLPHVYRTDKRGGRTSTENGYSRQVVYLSWEEGGGRSRPARVGPHLTAEGRSRRAAVSHSVSPPAGKGKVAHAWVAGPELTTRKRVLAPPLSSASGCAASGGQGGDRGTALAGAAAVCCVLCAGAAATVAVGVATLQSGGRGLDPACQPEPGTFFAEQSALLKDCPGARVCPCAVGRAHITTWRGSGSIPKHATTHSHTQLAHSPLHVGGHQCPSSYRRCVASQHHERGKGASGTSAFLPAVRYFLALAS